MEFGFLQIRIGKRMGSRVGPKSCAKPLNGEQRKAPSVGCGSDEAERCLKPANGSLSSNAPASDRPFLSIPRNTRRPNLRWPGLKSFCFDLEPFATQRVMRFEALFCPHMGLRLPDPPRAGFS